MGAQACPPQILTLSDLFKLGPWMRLLLKGLSGWVPVILDLESALTQLSSDLLVDYPYLSMFAAYLGLGSWPRFCLLILYLATSACSWPWSCLWFCLPAWLLTKLGSWSGFALYWTWWNLGALFAVHLLTWHQQNFGPRFMAPATLHCLAAPVPSSKGAQMEIVRETTFIISSSLYRYMTSSFKDALRQCK